MLKVAIILGSTRPGRKSEAVGRWVHALATPRTDASFELVDLRDFNLPQLDEPAPAAQRQYTQPHTLAWSAKISAFDAFVFVTPEYNAGIPGVLKNALDFLFQEWNDKAAAFVSYGGMGGVRAVEQLRLTLNALQMAPVRSQVTLSLRTDFENGAFKPAPHHEKTVKGMLDQLVSWSGALRALRKA